MNVWENCWREILGKPSRGVKLRPLHRPFNQWVFINLSLFFILLPRYSSENVSTDDFVTDLKPILHQIRSHEETKGRNINQAKSAALKHYFRLTLSRKDSRVQEGS